MDWFDILTEGIGVVALILCLLCFQMKNRSVIMIMQMTASLLFSVQLFMVGAITGAILDVISFVRTLIFSRRESSKWAQSPLWLYSFLIVMIFTGILTWDNIFSLFAILGTLLSTFALWMKNPKYIRLISLLVGPCWITYHIFVGTYTGIINEVLALTSIIIGLIRNDIIKKPQNKESDSKENAVI